MQEPQNVAIPWGCTKCGVSGEVSGLGDAAQVVALAAAAHAEMEPLCAEEWGANYLRINQHLPYPD